MHDQDLGVGRLGSDDEVTLVEEMEQLRQELYRLLNGRPDLLSSPKVCALSARLDLLITRYMGGKPRSSVAGH